MDSSSLPSYPPPPQPRTTDPQPLLRRRLTPRQFQVLVNLIWLAAIVVFLVGVRQAAHTLRQPPHPAPEPLPFKVVAERFHRVHSMMPVEEVFKLLGPERFERYQEPEMDEYERLIEAHPDRYPEPRYWAKWEDPDDPGRWVAILICRGYVYQTLKRGV